MKALVTAVMLAFATFAVHAAEPAKKVETKQEYKEAKKLISLGWVALNILCNGSVVQFCKISE